MHNRRQFVKHLAGATAGMLLVGPAARAARREIVIGGRRIRTVDVHAHCIVPDVVSIIKDAKLAATVKAEVDRPPLVLGPQRLQAMDEMGVDVQALSINAFWYGVEREAARDIIKMQNQKLAAWCKAHPDRFVAFASVALQHPDLAAEQLEEAVKNLGMRGAAIGGSVEGEELSSRRFDSFWAKAEELGVLIFMHPQGAPGTTQNPRLEGRGRLGNTIGNPLETTVFLSHLIFEGTLDRYPGLRICGAHAGGYLASYSGRSDALCARETGEDCRNLKKKPSEYFKKELFVDTMIFHESGLRHLVTEYGASQVMYGSDNPFDWPAPVDFVLNASFLSDADKIAILGGNASKLLRIA